MFGEGVQHMTVHIRRCAGNKGAWCAELEPSGRLCDSAYSLDDLVTRLAHHPVVVLHLGPTEALRNVDRYIREYEAEIAEAKRIIRSNNDILKRMRAEREEIVRRHAPEDVQGDEV
jgi:hypothetical protein